MDRNYCEHSTPKCGIFPFSDKAANSLYLQILPFGFRKDNALLFRHHKPIAIRRQWKKQRPKVSMHFMLVWHCLDIGNLLSPTHFLQPKEQRPHLSLHAVVTCGPSPKAA